MYVTGGMGSATEVTPKFYNRSEKAVRRKSSYKGSRVHLTWESIPAFRVCQETLGTGGLLPDRPAGAARSLCSQGTAHNTGAFPDVRLSTANCQRAEPGRWTDTAISKAAVRGLPGLPSPLRAPQEPEGPSSSFPTLPLPADTTWVRRSSTRVMAVPTHHSTGVSNSPGLRDCRPVKSVYERRQKAT